MTRLTADIISRVVFGSSYEKGKQIIQVLTVLQRLCVQASRHLCIPGSRWASTALLHRVILVVMMHEPNPTIHTHELNLRVPSLWGRTFAQIVDDASMSAQIRSSSSSIERIKVRLIWFCPYASVIFCCRFLPSKYNREIVTLKTEMERLLKEIIESRKDSTEMGMTDHLDGNNDILSLLLHQMPKRNGVINLQLVMDECKTFSFAGHETASLLLTWTIMLLASNPTWQERARAEVLQVHNGRREMTVDHLSRLTLVGVYSITFKIVSYFMR